VSVRPRPSLARPITSQLSLSISDSSGSENSRTRGFAGVPLIATPTRTSRFGRVASMSRRGFSTAPLKRDLAAVDRQLLAVGRVGAVDRAHRAVDGEPAARRR
jgi:hypothetical protein